MRRTLSNPATLVILAGVCAALHVGKLPPAIPVLRDALGVTWLQAGFLLSLVQLAGMTLGLLVGLGADGAGLRRSMLTGLCMLAVASTIGGWARDASELMVLRAVEGLGFLLVTLPAPSLIRRLVSPSRLSTALGFWGAYMPLGTALALLSGPAVMAVIGWQGWWWLLATLSALMALWVWRRVPADAPAAVHAGFGPAADAEQSRHDSWLHRLRQTLVSPGPWLVALTFAVYSGQWLAVIGFLPSLYEQAGFGLASVGPLTAVAAAVNIVGNVTAGRLLRRGWPAQRLLVIGFCAMGVGALLAFGLPPGLVALRYAGVLLFSMLGGMIPGTLFSLAVRLAPGPQTVSTTVGWMQQWSSVGQFAGPPLVAWVAGWIGGWQWTWVVTGSCSVLGLLLALRIRDFVAREEARTVGG